MRGLFDRFMRAFNIRMRMAIRYMNRTDLGVENLSARIEGRFIRLSGVAQSREAAARAVDLFKQLVEVDNILDAIRIAEPPSEQKV
jgi:hypothetical protein